MDIDASNYGMDWNDTALRIHAGKTVHFLFDGSICLRDPLYPGKSWFVKWSVPLHRWTVETVGGEA